MISSDIQKNIETFFEKLPFEISIEFSNDEKMGFVWCTISSPDSSLLMGKNGENLYFIRYLIRRILENLHPDEKEIYQNIIFDINGYEKERIENIQSKAYMMAERARFFKDSIKCEPMSAFDRRIVHDFLSDCDDIETSSEGIGRDRHVVVIYTKDK